MVEKIMAPDEENFMKYYVSRIFTLKFFVDSLKFNARATKVQFKNTLVLRCFAGESERILLKKFFKKISFSDFLVVSMMRKFEKPDPDIDAAGSEDIVEKSAAELEDIIENYKTKIQNFITDYRLLVKRNANNWVH